MKSRRVQKKRTPPISLRDLDKELVLDTDLPVLVGRIEDRTIDRWFTFRSRRKNKTYLVHFYRGEAWLSEGKNIASKVT